MRIAYLTSIYPAVSQAWMTREIMALRARGIKIDTFTVHRAPAALVVGPEARREAEQTRALLPLAPGTAARAVLGGLYNPWRLLRAARLALGQKGATARQRLRALAHLMEALVLAHWLRIGRNGHLHCHFGNSGATVGLLAAELASISFSMTCHGSELREPHQHRLADKVARAKFVACVSWYGKAQLMLVTPPELWSKLHVIRCGAQLNAPAAPPPVLTAVPPESPLTILSAGRLASEKGHRVLLDALAELRRRGTPLRCRIVGDGPLRSDLTRYADTVGLNGELSFDGARDPADLQQLYLQTSVVVVSSFAEGVPAVLIEALALGRPVVATAVGGIPELVRHGETGLLVAPGNACELADALQWVREHPREAAALGRQGAARVRAEFDLDRAANQLCGLFTPAGMNSP